MISNVTALQINEQVRLDPECLADLFVRFGETGAEDVISDAMEALSILLNRIEKDYVEGDLAGIRQRALRLIETARQVGLTTFARVAGDVAECAATQNAVALSATLRRLSRLADQSFLAVWDVQDITV